MSRVCDYMTRRIVTCSPNASLLDVQRLLAEQHLTRVVILDSDGIPAGIISEKDVMRFVLTDRTKRRFEEVPAQQAMSSALVTIKPDERMERAAQAMIKMRTSSLMVQGDEPEGIVTKTDIVKYVCAEGSGFYSVGQFMTPNPITVNPTQSVFSIIELMSQNAISRVIVIDDGNEPLGIITLADFSQTSAYSLINLSKRLLSSPTEDETHARFLERAATLGLKAKDFMSQHPFTLNDDSDLADAARLMMKHDISGLPVTDDLTNLVGVISKTDLTRAVAYETQPRTSSILRNPYSKLRPILSRSKLGSSARNES
jgi:CBS domain-containing protein